MKRIAIITGASSGIGRDIARIADKRELFLDEIWLIGRSRKRLRHLANFLDTPCRVFPVDLAEEDSLDTFCRTLNEADVRVALLVNSAGFGFDGLMEEQMLQEIQGMIRVNAEALTILTRHVIRKMDDGGRILNIASAAAYLPQPFFAVYAATKAYVLSFSRALSKELASRDIIVTAACPGPVDTAFFERMRHVKSAVKVFPKADSMAVASEAYEANARGREVTTYGLPFKAFRALCKVVPHSVLLKGYAWLLHAGNYCQ